MKQYLLIVESLVVSGRDNLALGKGFKCAALGYQRLRLEISMDWVKAPVKS